jgi:hypothetical protein
VNTLLVQRTDLRDALNFLKPYVRLKKPGTANIVFDSGVLIIQAGPVSARLRAEGTWDGTATCSGLVILGLHEGLPADDQIAIAFESERLRVGNYSFPCGWDELRDLPVTLPLGASVNMILSCRLLYTEAELTRAGLIADLRNAEKSRDKAFAAAAKALRPLEITERDLMEYHALRLKQQYLGVASSEVSTGNAS